MNEILNKYSNQIKMFLQSYLDKKGEIFKSINKWGFDVIKRLADFSMNGKLVRGSLVLFAQNMYGKNNDIESIKTAASLELFHSSLLIHDDIIDSDELRRGNPSVYHQYKIAGADEKIRDSHQFGVSMGICAGDIGFFLGFELLSTLNINNISKDKILELLSREFSAVGLGQMQDIYFGVSAREPSEEDILKLYLYKTARYTFSLPFMLGGILANIAEQEIKYLEKLGEYLGLIFQMKDDELGLFGEKSELGKPIGSDIEADKKTLYYLYLFRHSTDQEKSRLRSLFGSSGLSVKSVEYVKDLIIRHNIKQNVDKRIDEYKNNAEEIIAKMNIDNNYKEMLRRIIEYNLNRTK